MNTQDFPSGSDTSFAPWNSKEVPDCESCGNKGLIQSYFCIDCEETNHDSKEKCPYCGGDDLEQYETNYCKNCNQ